MPKSYERHAVLAEAMNLFWERGYQGASVRDLCDATGLNRKTLYGEFTSKDALYCEALGLYTGGALAGTRAVLTAAPLGLGNVRRYFGGMAYGPDCKGCLMTMTVNEGGQVPSPALDQVRVTLAEIESLLADNLRAAGITATRVAELTAFLVFIIQGITTMGKLEGDEARLGLVIDTVLSVLQASQPE